MKKLMSIVSCLLLMCFVVTAFAACASEKPDSLVIYNWADYIFDEKLTDFKEYYKEITGKDIDVTYVTFDTNETMLTRLTQGDSNVDVVCPSEYAIQKLIEGNMLVPLNYFDEAKYTSEFSESVKNGYEHNSDNIEPGIIEKVSGAFGSLHIDETGETVSMVDYFVPYMYGTLGILYNKYAFMDLGIYDAEIMNKANWGIFFNDDGDGNMLSPGLTGNILMKDSIRDSYAATIFYMLERGMLDGRKNEHGVLYTDLSAGELINAVDDQLLDIVRRVLVNQKDELFGYEVDFGKDDLLMGNAIVDLAWSGDAMFAVEESWDKNIVNDDGTKGDYRLAYYVPHSAGNIWFDGWVVPKTYNPKHMEAIKIFINYLNRPKSAALNYLEIGYTPAIRPEVLQEDDDAMQILMEGYEYDFDSAEDREAFVEEFFNYVDEIDGSNWRYPFLSAELNDDNYRNIDTLGVMRDFGDKNKMVVTAWNYARSAGVSALPLLGWTVLAVAVALGVLFAVIGFRRWKSHRVITHTSSETQVE
ncbi:MAG: extracellular solute-binding protein [Clostridiales bacterium]|nr:extracellular solute-binding protein [Clostridiales bacterium]